MLPVFSGNAGGGAAKVVLREGNIEGREWSRGVGQGKFGL